MRHAGKGARSVKATDRAGAQKRVPINADRALEIVTAATQLFAEEGFRVPLQRLADRIGITQPLIHHYFPTKADLVRVVKEGLRLRHWKRDWSIVLMDAGRPLPDRIAAFYEDYLPSFFNPVWYRAFVYAALEDATFAQAHLDHVTHELLGAIIQAVRLEFGYADIEALPPREREVELVWGLHSTFTFLGQRRYIYEMEVSRDLGATIRDQIFAYLSAAPVVMADLLGPPAVQKENEWKARSVRSSNFKIDAPASAN
jgi:AcrR family transcriptional regulator